MLKHRPNSFAMPSRWNRGIGTVVRMRTTSLLLASLFSAITAPVALAETYTVSSPAGLIEAINASNARLGADTIRLEELSPLNFSQEYTDGLALPVITDELRIEGNRSTLSWSGESFTGLLKVAPVGALELIGIALEGARGGAVTVEGRLVMRWSRLTDNTNVHDGAGALTIATGGEATVFRTVFDGNEVASFSVSGGAIHNSGSLFVSGSSFRDNTSAVRCGRSGIPCRPGSLGPYFDAIYNLGDTRVVNSTFQGNAVVNQGNLEMIHATVLDSSLENPGNGDFRLANSAVFGGICTGVDSQGHNVSGGGECALGHASDRTIGFPVAGLGDRLVTRRTLLVPNLAPGSPLLDGADPSLCPADDALNRSRPIDGDHDGLARCDIGAVELRPGEYEVDDRVVGLWYEPDRDGHALLVEMPEPGHMTVFWATGDGKGNPLWLFGSGDLQGNRLEVPLVAQRGMRFGSFRPIDLSVSEWGTLAVEFSDCSHLTMAWDVREQPGLNGEASLTRLTEVRGLECLP